MENPKLHGKEGNIPRKVAYLGGGGGFFYEYFLQFLSSSSSLLSLLFLFTCLRDVRAREYRGREVSEACVNYNNIPNRYLREEGRY